MCGLTGAGLYLWRGNQSNLLETPVEVELVPAPDTPTVVGVSSTLETLLNADVPINNPVDIAQRLEGKENLPLTLPVDNL